MMEMRPAFVFVLVLLAACASALRNPRYKSLGGPVPDNDQPVATRQTSHWAMKVIDDAAVATFPSEAGVSVQLSVLLQDDTDVVEVQTSESASFRNIASIPAAEGGFRRGPSKVHRQSFPSVSLKTRGGLSRGRLAVRVRSPPGQSRRSSSRVVTVAYDSTYKLQCESLGDPFVGVETGVRCSFFNAPQGDSPLPDVWRSATIQVVHDRSNAQQFSSFSPCGEWQCATFVPSTPGHFRLEVLANGFTSSGDDIMRSDTMLIRVVKRVATDLAGASMDFVTSPSGLRELSLKLDLAGVDAVTTTEDAATYGKFLVSGSLYGHNSNNEIVPITIVGGMSDLDGNSLEVFVQEDHFYGDVHAPFILQRIQISHGLTNTVFASKVGVAVRTDIFSIPDPVSTGVQPRMHHRRDVDTPVPDADVNRQFRLSESPEDRTDRQLMGPKPPSPVGPSSSGVRLQTGVQKRVLVHGYCSDHVWPLAHFTDPFEFVDLDQNRSNDEFAIRIWSQTTNAGIYGCGIIAHSQGGLASLHLYTYYWSCIDNADQNIGGRRIQSVGSPYQGTYIAGFLATLASVFGVQCGSQYDLTETGATLWLSNIPSASRALVNYYTTSFSTSGCLWCYCSSVTDLVLTDPDDGVVAQYRGQLPGGVNRGHQYGQCHTTGMSNPAQYADATRNSVMNANSYY